MYDIRVVEVQNGLGQLVNNVLFVSFLEMFVIAVLPDQRMQINVHVLEHQVDIFVVLCPDDVVDADDVLLFELFEEHDLTVGSLGVCGVREGVEVLFQRFDLFGLAVSHFPHYAIRPAADFLYRLVHGQHVRLYFVRHTLYNLLLLLFIYLYDLTITELTHINYNLSIIHSIFSCPSLTGYSSIYENQIQNIHS